MVCLENLKVFMLFLFPSFFFFFMSHLKQTLSEVVKIRLVVCLTRQMTMERKLGLPDITSRIFNIQQSTQRTAHNGSWSMHASIGSLNKKINRVNQKL